MGNKGPLVLMIGPVAPPLGGMTISLSNIVDSRLKDKYDLRVLDITGYRTRRGGRGNVFLGILHELRLIFELASILIGKGPKIVHIQMASFFYFYRRSVDIIICRLFGKKVIFHLRGASFIDFYDKSGLAGRTFIKAMLGLSNRIIVLSEYWRGFVSGIADAKKISVVPNGVEADKFALSRGDGTGSGHSDIRISVLFMGPVGKRKGAFDLLEAIPAVRQKVKDIVFIFSGKGEFEGELELFKRKVAEKGLEGCVRLTGDISGQEKIDRYISSDIFAMPSYAENFPNSVLEAMAAGLPVVVSDVGAIPEFVKDGVNGFIVKAGDAGAIAAKIATLAMDGDLRGSIGKSNRELVRQKYDMPIIAGMLDRIYQGLLAH